LGFYSRPVKDDANRFIGRLWNFTEITERVRLAEELRMANLSLERKVEERTLELEKRNQELLQTKVALEKAQEAVQLEMEMARQVQESILPKDLPKPASLRLSALYIPTSQVGGDFYDAVVLDKENVFLMISDVCGHGVPSAMISMMARMSFSRNAPFFYHPAKLNEVVNHELSLSLKTEHYLTTVTALLNMRTGLLTYSRVCHSYPIIYRAETGDMELLTTNHGYFLGMFPEGRYTQGKGQLQRGDKLLLYTDGLVECFDRNREQYGRPRLLQSIHQNAALQGNEFLQALIKDKERFTAGGETTDDITLLAVERV